MYIYGSIPFFECLVRAEYTRNLKSGHGEFLPAIAHAVRCVRGHSLWFQVIFTEQHAGAAFMLPIEALVSKPCAPVPTAQVQPWDVFSSDFGVSADTFTARGAVEVLPARTRAQYRFTLDFAGSDLAEHPEQHKALHVVFCEDGIIGAYPNNRLLWSDPAFWATTTERPPFESLAGEFRAEGNQELFTRGAAPEPAIGDISEALSPDQIIAACAGLPLEKQRRVIEWAQAGMFGPGMAEPDLAGADKSPLAKHAPARSWGGKEP